ncbi:MAG: hypothetical protein KAZ26_20020 [Caldilineaceae bacterium]|nr:hypothetical protein [Caldilineaceae bacterium]
MTQPTTDAQKYDAATLVAQTVAQINRQRELTAAAHALAEDNRAAFELQRGHALDLSNRLVEIRNIATVALYDHERMTVAVLGDALAEILTIARETK